MSTLDNIASERQRLAERLARLDAEQVKLAEQLAELDAAERVLSRLSPTKAASLRRGRRARTAETAEPVSALARRRGPGRGGRKAVGKQTLPLRDATFRAVGALGNDSARWVTMARLSRSASISGKLWHAGAPEPPRYGPAAASPWRPAQRA
jgi:hypothetical protein